MILLALCFGKICLFVYATLSLFKFFTRGRISRCKRSCSISEKRPATNLASDHFQGFTQKKKIILNGKPDCRTYLPTISAFFFFGCQFRAIENE